MAVIVGLVVTTLALAASTIYLEVRGPSTSYVDGYNFAVCLHSRSATTAAAPLPTQCGEFVLGVVVFRTPAGSHR